MPILIAGAIIIAALIGAALALHRTARRSGVSDADLARALPGDELVPDATLVMDRAAVFNAPPEAVWPWIAQLGKGRAGWYCPRWLERFTGGTQLSGIRHIEPGYQHLEVGDETPDYGPGEPVFRVTQVEAPRVLVYLTLRDPAARWTWPQSDPPPDGTLALSWALLLEPARGGRCRVTARVRATRQGKPMAWWFYWLGGLVDWLTIALMFAGLRERLAES